MINSTLQHAVHKQLPRLKRYSVITIRWSSDTLVKLSAKECLKQNMLVNTIPIFNILTKQSVHSSFECQHKMEFRKVYLTFVSHDCLLIYPGCVNQAELTFCWLQQSMVFISGGYLDMRFRERICWGGYTLDEQLVALETYLMFEWWYK